MGGVWGSVGLVARSAWPQRAATHLRKMTRNGRFPLRAALTSLETIALPRFLILTSKAWLQFPWP